MSDQARKIAQTLLSHLERSGQTPLLVKIVEFLQKSPAYHTSQTRVTITSTLPLGKAELASLGKYLVKNVGPTYQLDQRQDASLLAGFTLQIGDTFIDSSLLGKINSLHNKLTTKESL